eukprot:2294055-Amphidinium_carterae.1
MTKTQRRRKQRVVKRQKRIIKDLRGEGGCSVRFTREQGRRGGETYRFHRHHEPRNHLDRDAFSEEECEEEANAECEEAEVVGVLGDGGGTFAEDVAASQKIEEEEEEAECEEEANAECEEAEVVDVLGDGGG